MQGAQAFAASVCAAFLMGAAPVGEGWVEVPSPHGSFIAENCANWSQDEWRVSREGDALQIGRVVAHGTDTTAALGAGTLKGMNHGEWGGALTWTGRDGKPVQLIEDDIHALVPVASGVLVLTGLDHLGLSGGGIYRVTLKDGAPAIHETAKLGASAENYTVAPDGNLLVLTAEGLYRVTPLGDATRLTGLDTGSFYPNSLAVSGHGTVDIGMRHYVVRLTPKDGGYETRWWAPRECAAYRRETEHGPCICEARH